MAWNSEVEISLAAGLAAISVDGVVHPLDTLVTRMQSPNYTRYYKKTNGTPNGALFRGLYSGFGPTLLAGAPSAAAFFVVYESLKGIFRYNSHLQDIPQPIAHAISSAAADIVGCAIFNPAEVLKQNAQVYQQGKSSNRDISPTVELLRQFSRQPSKMWTGYTALVARHVPGTALTLSLYEYLKDILLQRSREIDAQLAESIYEHIRASALSASLAGACVSGILVPIDVVKTNMRLRVGHEVRQNASSYRAIERPSELKLQVSRPCGPFSMAADIFRKRGIQGLFRGGTLTCVAVALGDGLYFSLYEGSRLYLQDRRGNACEC